MKAKLVSESLDEYSNRIPPTYDQMPDITRIGPKKSIGPRFEALIKIADQFYKNPEELKDRALAILDDPTTHASFNKRNEYRNALYKANTFREISSIITNIYLAAAKLKLNKF